jgi:hypothetical protein
MVKAVVAIERIRIEVIPFNAVRERPLSVLSPIAIC